MTILHHSRTADALRAEVFRSVASLPAEPFEEVKVR